MKLSILKVVMSQIRTATRFVWYFFVLGRRSVQIIAMLPKAMLVN